MAEGVPKYIAVRDNLRQRAQAMYSGEQLPPEPELCDQYGVSRITLRHAVDDLIQDGLLVREQGRGTFRTAKQGESQHEVISDHIRGFFRQQADLGNTVDTKVLDNAVVRNAKAAQRLGLPDDADLVRLERLRYVDDKLKQHVITFLSARGSRRWSIRISAISRYMTFWNIITRCVWWRTMPPCACMR